MNLINARPGEAQHFWAEVSPCDHLVQIYESDAVFLDSLEGFVAAGFKAGEAVIIVATQAHRQDLESRLAKQFDLYQAGAPERYIVRDAAETLAMFMVNDWPDEVLFKEVIASLLKHAGSRRVRACGEMVALLWAQGHCAATVRLEFLWHRFCAEEHLSLLCAYPQSGFTGDARDSIRLICDAHSHVVESFRLIPRAENSLAELTRRL